jgi:hypothetical protein
MRRCTLGAAALVIVGCGSLLVRAAESQQVSIDELRVPASPAFIMLGVSPTLVERPSTPRALALSLITATERTDSDSGIPKDIAIEFAPYWWQSRPELTFESYYARDKKLLATIAQTFALSLGTTDLEDLAGIDGSRAALGLRFMVRQGSASKDLEPHVQKLQAAQVLLAACAPDEPTEPVDQACVARVKGELEAARDAVITNAERVGFTLEVASALSRDFPAEDADAVSNTRFGAWVTASYHTEGSLSIVGVARYLGEDEAADQGHAQDLGGRLIWKNEAGAAMPPMSISLEYLRRFAERGDDSSRLVGVLEFRLPIENVSLVASYGKDFEDLTGHQDLVSTLGVSFGFGRQPVVEKNTN